MPLIRRSACATCGTWGSGAPPPYRAMNLHAIELQDRGLRCVLAPCARHVLSLGGRVERHAVEYGRGGRIAVETWVDGWIYDVVDAIDGITKDGKRHLAFTWRGIASPAAIAAVKALTADPVAAQLAAGGSREALARLASSFSDGTRR